MLECLSFNSLTPSLRNPPPLPPPASNSQGNSTTEEDTPATSPNVSREYDLAVTAHSFNEILSMVQAPPPQVRNIELEQEQDHDGENDEESHHRHVLAQVLQPDPNSIREAIDIAKPGKTLTRLVSTYFDHSETTTSDLCHLLRRSVHRARLMYGPISDLLSVLPAADDSPSLSQHQCDRAYDLFLQFDRHENPFAFPNFQTLRRSFSDLRIEIQRDRRKCHHRIRLFRHATAGCAVCLVATAAAAIASAAVVAVHAAVGFAAVACIPRPKKNERIELARLKQLDAADNGAFVVYEYINTIDSLVDRLRTAVEGDKGFVRFALERGRERHPIQEVLKELRKTHPTFEQLLNDLEKDIYFCFYTIKKARYALLKEICLHQTL